MLTPEKMVVFAGRWREDDPAALDELPITWRSPLRFDVTLRDLGIADEPFLLVFTRRNFVSWTWSGIAFERVPIVDDTPLSALPLGDYGLHLP